MSRVKNLSKKLLAAVGFLEPARKVIYWTTKFDPNSTHPHRRFVRFYSQFIRKGDLCFDVGANIGERTRIFLELGATVVSVEPQSACLEKLRRSFGRNPRVTLVGKALSDHEGYADLAVCEEAPIISSLSEDWLTKSRFSNVYGYQWHGKEKVELTTLDRLIALYGLPQFCKIDVEGYEAAVLGGLSLPIPCISFEFNREFLSEAKRCADRLLSIADYEFNFSLAEPVEVIKPPWITAAQLFVSLDAIPDKLLWGDIYARLRA